MSMKGKRELPKPNVDWSLRLFVLCCLLALFMAGVETGRRLERDKKTFSQEVYP